MPSILSLAKISVILMKKPRAFLLVKPPVDQESLHTTSCKRMMPAGGGW